MTSTVTHNSPTTGSRIPLIAGIGVVASLVATAVGTFWDLTNNEKSNNHSSGEYLFTIGTTAICAAIVFGLVVRTAARGNASRRAAILGVVSVLSIAVFWAGFPIVVAAGALACALTDRDQTGGFGAGAKTGLVLATLSTACAAVLAVIG